jgi:hypothetical protein
MKQGVFFVNLVLNTCALLFVGQMSASAEEPASAAALAQELQNPVANLISVPYQFNYDQDIGVADGDRVTLNVQPVIPISISDDWNLISRTILPLISQSDIAGDSGDQTGTGDILQSAFFSPKAPTSNGWILGAGPVFLLPTASDDLLGGEKWGAGPTAVALKQDGPLTLGLLSNQVWSYAGDDDRKTVNSTFLQPFIGYTTPEAWSFTMNTESTYDWTDNQWSVPINAVVSKVVKIGNQPVSIGGGPRYWVDSPDATGPEGWGGRFFVTFLFPK